MAIEEGKQVSERNAKEAQERGVFQSVVDAVGEIRESTLLGLKMNQLQAGRVHQLGEFLWIIAMADMTGCDLRCLLW